ncbi:MAG: NAD(P)H-dependent oxidoreductase [Oscillospiraceae bacterium]|nr:NAD(P)H-dependent oxidoreductase [Oscillospiraceae bacterium]
MKIAVVYYSLEGNTKFVAEKIAGRLIADLIELKCVKAYPTGKVSKFLWGGKSVTFGEKPALIPYNFNADEYDAVIIGSPVWASKYAPPLKTFFAENDISGKKLGFFTCCAGGKPDKCFAEMKRDAKHESVATLNLVEPLKNQIPENDVEIDKFCEKLKGAL